VAESIAMVRVGRYTQADEAAAFAVYNDEDRSAAEIPAFDPASKRLFVVNGQKAASTCSTSPIRPRRRC
jgi:hypothetical protein